MSTALAFSPDGRYLATAGILTNEIQIWDLLDQNKIASFTYPLPVNLVFNNTGSHLFVASADENFSTIGIWQMISEEDNLKIHVDGELFADTQGIIELEVSPDGSMLAATGIDGRVFVWDLRSRQELMILDGHTDVGQGVSFSPNGNLLASSSMDGTGIIWDLQTENLAHKLVGHNTGGAGFNDWVVDIGFNPTGDRVITASFDGTAKIWQVADGQELFTISGHSAAVGEAIYSPDGSTIVTGAEDHLIKVWDSETLAEQYTLTGHSKRVTDLDFSNDGRYLVSSSEDGTVRIYIVDVEEFIALVLSRLTRWFTLTECENFLHTDVCPAPPWDID